MGGTGIALARDGSAPFLNPATLLNPEDDGLAFSVNFYSYSSTRLTNFHQPGSLDRARFGNLDLPDTSESQGRFDALPSTLCLFYALPKGGEPGRRRGTQRLAGCLGSVERSEFSIDAARYTGFSDGRQTDQANSLSRKWSRFYAGPSYALYVTDDLALGIAVNGIYTTFTNVWSTNAVTVDRGGRAITSGLDVASDAWSLDLGSTLGATYKLDRYHTLGLSLTTPSIHVASDFNQTFETEYDGAGQYALLRTAHGGRFVSSQPLRVGAGFGAEYGRVRIEVDATYWFPRDELLRAEASAAQVTTVDGASTRTGSTVSLVQKADGIVNGAFGMEWLVNPSISVLGGASTDFSALPPMSETPSETQLAQSRVHRIAGSFGVGSYAPGSELLFGAEVSYGWGRSMAVDPYVLPNRTILVTQNTVGVMLVFAGSTSLATLRRTVDRLSDLVVPKPR